MKNSTRLLVVITILFGVLLACSISPKIEPTKFSQTAAVFAQETLQSIPPATDTPMLAPLPITETPSKEPVINLLPHPVYYLAKDPAGNNQIWKLEMDGKTTSQITSTENGVTDYDVSQANGLLAYITDNDLYILTRAGDTPLMIIDGDPQDGSDTWYMYKGLAYPVWSSDGKKLAFYHAGLFIYTPADGSIALIRKNIIDGGDFPTVKEMYHPILWSPDDTKLMVGISYYEGGTEAVYHFASDELIYLSKGNDGGGVCCDTVWAEDSSQVYIAGYSYGGESSDMWMFDANTGAPFEYIPVRNSNNRFNFVILPGIVGHQLYFFYSSLADYPVSEQTASLATSPDAVPASPSLLRNDSQYLVEAIWAEDGVFALGIRRGPMDGYPYYGELLYIPVGNDPVIQLLSDVRMIKWGL